MVDKFTEKNKKIIFKMLKKYSNTFSIKSLVEFEGMLVGSLCRPEIIKMDEINSLIWGEDESDSPTWDSQKEVEDFYSSLFALQNKNNTSLRGTYYKPQILKEKKFFKRWCCGFIKGVGGLDVIGNISEHSPIDVVSSALAIILLSEQHSTSNLKDDDSFQQFSLMIKECSIMAFSSKIKSLFDYFHDRLEQTHIHNENCIH